MRKFSSMMVSEKVPGVVCTVACLASVLMGFVLGYLFFDSATQTLVYADDDSAIVYRAEFTPTGYEYYGYSNDDYETITITPGNEIDNLHTHLYVVTTQDDFIAIYYVTENGQSIKELTDISIGALAPEEQERLACGILIYSEHELTLFLQDYGS